MNVGDFEMEFVKMSSPARIRGEHYRERAQPNTPGSHTKEFQQSLDKLLKLDAQYARIMASEQKGADMSLRRSELNERFAELNRFICAYAEKHASHIDALDLSAFELDDANLIFNYKVLGCCALLTGLRELRLPVLRLGPEDTRTLTLLRALLSRNRPLSVSVNPPDDDTAQLLAHLAGRH